MSHWTGDGVFIQKTTHTSFTMTLLLRHFLQTLNTHFAQKSLIYLTCQLPDMACYLKEGWEADSISLPSFSLEELYYYIYLTVWSLPRVSPWILKKSVFIAVPALDPSFSYHISRRTTLFYLPVFPSFQFAPQREEPSLSKGTDFCSYQWHLLADSTNQFYT